MEYRRGDAVVTQRSYTYDALGRPLTRDTQYPLKDIAHSDSFVHNSRSELVHAQLDDTMYGYDYDNIGKAADGCKADWTSASRHEPRRGEATMRCRRINRITAQEAAEGITYSANELNQYKSIVDGANTFEPQFDLAGNQTLVKTNSGTWQVTYTQRTAL